MIARACDLNSPTSSSTEQFNMQICDIEFIKSTKPNANHPRTGEKDLQQQGIDEANDLSSQPANLGPSTSRSLPNGFD